MYKTCSELEVFMYWTGKSMNNLWSYCGLVDVRINASEKDLPVISSVLDTDNSKIINGSDSEVTFLNKKIPTI
jgi:hypothetical protein